MAGFSGGFTWAHLHTLDRNNGEPKNHSSAIRQRVWTSIRTSAAASATATVRHRISWKQNRYPRHWRTCTTKYADVKSKLRFVDAFLIFISFRYFFKSRTQTHVMRFDALLLSDCHGNYIKTILSVVFLTADAVLMRVFVTVNRVTVNLSSLFYSRLF